VTYLLYFISLTILQSLQIFNTHNILYYNYMILNISYQYDFQDFINSHKALKIKIHIKIQT